ncbi:MAG: sugar ABC transporter permease [Anaerolineae bacterium]|nr:sugar ABC transporter permease [Anaerolineae bacterium]
MTSKAIAHPQEDSPTRAWLARNQGLLFVGPAILLFAIFVLYPVIYIFVASVHDWNGFSNATYVGLDNFVRLFTADRAFGLAMRNTVYWAILTIFPQMFIGFLFAYILNSGIPGQNIFRAIFYMPAIISPVVLGIIWQRIYNPFGGLLADVGLATGLRFLVQPYLADPKIAIFSSIAVNVWQWTGFSMLLYIAGLQGIPDEIIDAARVDGANNWQRIRRIIWPMLRHVHLTLILLGIIGTLQTFALIYALTEGGPNNATQMLPTYIFQQAFQLQSMGYAAAVSVVLLLIALTSSVFQVTVLGSKFALTQ